ncbi:hypothetical protein NKDENANG_02442 [Candidatus Entotheonellaceae bacterium PAL068K]
MRNAELRVNSLWLTTMEGTHLGLAVHAIEHTLCLLRKVRWSLGRV